MVASPVSCDGLYPNLEEVHGLRSPPNSVMRVEDSGLLGFNRGTRLGREHSHAEPVDRALADIGIGASQPWHHSRVIGVPFGTAQIRKRRLLKGRECSRVIHRQVGNQRTRKAQERCSVEILVGR
jgi:hypothetical protein